MNAEPIAWIYQNANTEQQYLVWHKQTGGRNWMPLFTLTDVQEAIRAERQACADLARQWDVEHPDTNYGKCIAGHIEMRGA